MKILPCMLEWYEQHKNVTTSGPTFIGKLTKAIEANGGKVKVYTLITEIEAKAIKAINGVTHPMASASKRFARQMNGAPQLTDKQREYLWALVWRFRRQIKDSALVAEAKRIGSLPPPILRPEGVTETHSMEGHNARTA